MKKIHVFLLILVLAAAAAIVFIVAKPRAPAVTQPTPRAIGTPAPTSTPVVTSTITPTTTPRPSPTSGIMGTVLLGPTCPVERDPPDPQCADKPYQASLVVTTPDGARIIAKFSSDTAGKFKVSVPPGTYAIRSADTNTIYPRCSSTGDIIVKANAFTNIPVSCDTGIR